jgi:hypothetical protein
MKTIVLTSSFMVALGLGSAAAAAQATAEQPASVATPPAAATPAAPAPKATAAQPAPQAGFVPAESAEVQPPPRPSHLSGGHSGMAAHSTRVYRQAEHRSLRYASQRHAEVYALPPSYEIAAEKRRLAYQAGYRQGMRAATVYSYRRPVYRARARVAYVARVTHAYAETPFAYDLPRETYATGIFPTVSAIGLHSYDYAYTTRIRPIATYAGATGSYAGGYPIYNRPLAPAYPTCPCY